MIFLTRRYLFSQPHRLPFQLLRMNWKFRLRNRSQNLHQVLFLQLRVELFLPPRHLQYPVSVFPLLLVIYPVPPCLAPPAFSCYQLATEPFLAHRCQRLLAIPDTAAENSGPDVPTILSLNFQPSGSCSPPSVRHLRFFVDHLI